MGRRKKHAWNEKQRMPHICHRKYNQKREKSQTLIKNQELNRWNIEEEVDNDFPTWHTIKRDETNPKKGTCREVEFLENLHQTHMNVQNDREGAQGWSKSINKQKTRKLITHNEQREMCSTWPHNPLYRMEKLTHLEDFYSATYSINPCLEKWVTHI